MGDSLIEYIERLELLAFFAGYPLVYAIVNFLSGAQRRDHGAFLNRLVKLMPYAYAFTGTLFLGLVLKEAVTDKNIGQAFRISYLKIWGVCAVLFWFPVLSKKTLYSLSHSLIFFFILLKDILMGMGAVSAREIVRNDMKIYTASFLLNIVSLCIIAISYFIIKKTGKSEKENKQL